MPVFVIDETKIRAAQLLAEDKLTDKQIARRGGVARETIRAVPVAGEREDLIPGMSQMSHDKKERRHEFVCVRLGVLR